MIGGWKRGGELGGYECWEGIGRGRGGDGVPGVFPDSRRGGRVLSKIREPEWVPGGVRIKRGGRKGGEGGEESSFRIPSKHKAALTINSGWCKKH